MPLKLVKPVILGLAFLIFLSCSEWQTKKSTALLEIPAAKESEVNDSIVMSFGQEIENLIHQKNSKAYIDNFDYRRFVQRITYVEGGEKSLAEFKKSFYKGFKKGVHEIPDRIISEVEAGGFYDFISYTYDIQSMSYRMLFRLYSEETGLNYHDYELVNKNSQFQIVDIYIYSTGENLSESMNKIFLSSVPKSIVEKILKPKNTGDAAHFAEASKAIKQQDFENALNHLDKIKGDIKNKKIFHVIKVQAASQLADDIHLKALEAFKDQYPDDPSGNLMFVDYYVLKGDYQSAILALRKLQEATNDDFLNYLKANLFYEAGQIEKAIDNYKDVVENYPDYSTAYLNLLGLYTEKGMYAESIGLIDSMLSANFFLPNEMVDYIEATEPDGSNILEALVESIEYQKWKANVVSI